MFTNLNLTDMETCYKVFKKDIIKNIDLKEKRFGFDPEITAKMAKMKPKIFEVGISYFGRTYDQGKKIKLKDTGFPQLTAEDVIKHKVLMEYGTPKEYDGVWHNYGDENSIFRVRKLDERNVKVEVDGLQIADKLNKAIEDVYSQQGIEYKKRLMMDGIDL